TYKIERLLGRGGMGAVYQAEHLRTHKQVALKILRPGFGKIREVAKRFEREALTTSLLSHPGVVQVDDYGELEDGALFLVMELVLGASLREMIDAGVILARASPEHNPPRPQARQREVHARPGPRRRGAGEDPRLRHRQGGRSGRGSR